MWFYLSANDNAHFSMIYCERIFSERINFPTTNLAQLNHIYIIYSRKQINFDPNGWNLLTHDPLTETIMRKFASISKHNAMTKENTHRGWHFFCENCRNNNTSSFRRWKIFHSPYRSLWHCAACHCMRETITRKKKRLNARQKQWPFHLKLQALYILFGVIWPRRLEM